MNFAKQFKHQNKVDNFKLDHELSESIRLNKYISDSGVASRREADKMIEFKRIKVNDKIALVGTKIFPDDVVKLDNKIISPLTNRVYIALNKPVGIVSTTDTAISGNMITFMDYKEKIFPIGRLDKDSSGLILLTNDGNVVNKILRAENGHEKEYIVTVDKPITDEFIQLIQTGVQIYNPVTHMNQKTLPTKVTKLTDNTFKLILKQGLNRQIRRMADSLGYHVIKLERIRIMHILLDKLPEGYWRYLTKDELDTLNDMIKN